MLKIKIPNICQNEQRYALDIMLGEFLGLPFEADVYDGEFIEINRPDNSAKLTLDASFFHKAHQAWLNPESMPVLPLATWKPSNDGIKANLVEPSVPILYGQPGLERNGEYIHSSLDIFGSAFFMLSRYEELIIPSRDKHDRFPVWASVAFKANFLDRPIVNEYLEILWEYLHSIWPDLHRKERKFRNLISCDVDHPIDLAGYSLKRTIHSIGARLIRDKNLKLAVYNGLNYLYKKFGSNRFDVCRNNIDWMMKVNDAAGNKVAFYFIPIQTDQKKEDPNDVRSESISALLKHIADSGHEIGFHPGYNTYKFSENFLASANALKEACLNKRIDTANLGGRQHYLRYDVDKTPKLWQESGFIYDSSLCYAEKAGFRCGTCYEYSLYDLEERKRLKLKERPLIAMESSVISKRYMGLGYSDEALKVFISHKNICRKYKGDFVFLWHNSHFHYKSDESLYLSILEA